MSKNPIHDSVALVLQVGKEILITRRQPHLRAFGGHWTFPGGKIDPKDNGDELMALAREAQEELGLEILKDPLVISTKKLRTCVSPDFNPHRYQTHFYLVTYKTKPKLIFEEYEISDHRWAKPEDLLRDFNKGEFLTVPPILYLLHDLMKKPLPSTQKKKVPWVEMVKGLVQIMPKSVTLPPAQRTNSFYIEGLLVDPSPKNEEEYQGFLETLSLFEKPFAIFLTHHHPDHIQFAPDLARRFKIPIKMSSFTFEILKEKKGLAFFQGTEVQVVKEKDMVTTWMGENVQCVEIPGHDEGQMALMPENKFWFLAGDLFQGRGSVVIPMREGNMRKYMDSLRKVIKLKPQVIVPSHGIPLGGTYVLEKLLKHREKRLAQVRELYHQGKNLEEMLAEIYIELTHAKLRELAKENILKNIELIESEK